MANGLRNSCKLVQDCMKVWQRLITVVVKTASGDLMSLKKWFNWLLCMSLCVICWYWRTLYRQNLVELEQQATANRKRQEGLDRLEAEQVRNLAAPEFLHNRRKYLFICKFIVSCVTCEILLQDIFVYLQKAPSVRFWLLIQTDIKENDRLILLYSFQGLRVIYSTSGQINFGWRERKEWVTGMEMAVILAHVKQHLDDYRTKRQRQTFTGTPSEEQSPTRSGLRKETSCLLCWHE